MLKVGITGGIGSGKSTVSSVFEHLGVPIYNADNRAKWIVQHDTSLRQQIINAFGPESYADGSYNAPYIASLVFQNPDQLALLNSLVHPAVAKDYEQFCKQHEKQAYTLKEAAILFETGTYKSLDFTIMVYAPQSMRIERVMQRDGLEKEPILRRIESQMRDEEKLQYANHIIYNDQTRHIIYQVLEIHQILMHKALY